MPNLRDMWKAIVAAVVVAVIDTILLQLRQIPWGYEFAGIFLFTILVIYLLVWIEKKHLKKRLQIDQQRWSRLRQEKIEYRKSYENKKELPEKLLSLDRILTKGIEHQKLSDNQFILLMKGTFNWMSWPILIIVAVTYGNPITRRMFQKLHFNFTVQTAIRMNTLLKNYRIGTLPITTDKSYNTLYQEIITLENGLPPKIIAHINLAILLSNVINCLRLINAGQPFWKKLKYKTPMQEKLYQPLVLKLKDGLSYLTLQIDDSMSKIRAQVSTDIEGFLMGD